MTHGWRRVVFTTDGHSFGVFICYEEIFGDEIRLFVKRAPRCWSTSPMTAGTGIPALPGKRSICRACARSKIAAGFA